ncbi:MAG: YkgJ family cysteine cluster protein [Anaerolineae bacterium]|nr:YkgJ family cysteine cluster protein [Anaerolineae bacterium]
MTDFITDLEQISHLAAQHHDDFEVMRYLLQLDDELDDAVLDQFVEAVAEPVIAGIDCKLCANCCRSLDVYVTPEDAQRLAPVVDIPLEAIIEHEAAATVEEWGRLRAKPCRFLDGNLCSIYAHRPETCRTYPVFTPDFRWTLVDTIEGATLCPIIYNVLVRLLDRIDAFLKEQGK